MAAVRKRLPYLRSLKVLSDPFSKLPTQLESSSRVSLIQSESSQCIAFCSDSVGDAAVAVHPGLIQTGLLQEWLHGRDFFGPLQVVSSAILRGLTSIILETPEAAAQSLIFAALAPASEVCCCYQCSAVREAAKCSSDCHPSLLAIALMSTNRQAHILGLLATET